MEKEAKLEIKKDLTIRLKVSDKKDEQKRAAIKLIVDAPVYHEEDEYVEDEEITIAEFGTSGNLIIFRKKIERAGLTLEQG